MRSMLPRASAVRSSSTWASTLRLPRSTFPSRALEADRPEYLRQCTDELYRWQKSATAPLPKTFILHDGPPYANGSLHVGHALNKVLKDITCRGQLLGGRKVNFVPGWDCHGLPIELKALQRRNTLLPAHDDGQLSPVEVRKLARALAAETVEQQKAEFRRWAVMADWENAWTTMDKEFELRQLEIFRIMSESGLIHRRFKPVYWSPASRTALAEAELEYMDNHQSRSAYIKLAVDTLSPKLHSSLGHILKSLHVVIWTTTPWTLLANKAVAVHSDLEYKAVLSAKHGVLIVATSRLAELEKLCKEYLSQMCFATFMGTDLLGTTYHHPALGSGTDPQPILHGDFVSADSGTGLVHMAPGHGMDDYKACLQHGIEPFAPVDDKGCFTLEAFPPSPETFLGKKVLTEGSEAVLELLHTKDSIIATRNYKHSYPYDWRMKQPVIVRATQQWFADVGEIREAAIRSLEGVKFIPEVGKERLLSFVRNRSEWCISRQRAWGVPIPALYEEATGTEVITSESIAHIVQTIRERGLEAWWTDDEYDPKWVTPSLQGQNRRWRRAKDTMDVWFDSGTSWTQSENASEVCLEGSDQHRGWFQSSLLTKIATQNASNTSSLAKAPYEILITHGFTLDEDGRKMSKSIGNVISPAEIMEGTLLPSDSNQKSAKEGKVSPKGKSRQLSGMGPDALRLWVAGCDYTRDVVIGKQLIKAVNGNLIKLRSTFKLLTGLLDTHEAERSVPFDRLDMNNQIVLMQLEKLRSSVCQNYGKFEYQKVVSAINHFVNVDFSAVYVESIKDRMYASAKDSIIRKNTQIVLWEIFKRLAELLAPITPLLIEEACAHLPPQLSFHPVKDSWIRSIHQSSTRTEITGPWENAALKQDLPYLMLFNESVKMAQEKARSEKKMGSSLQSFVSVQFSLSSGSTADAMTGGSGGEISAFQTALERHASALCDLLVVSDVNLHSATPPHPAAADASWWSYTVPCESSSKTGGDSTTLALVHVYAPSRDKCERCWVYDVPKDNNRSLEAALCERCIGVLEGLRVKEEVGSRDSLFQDMPHLDEAAKKCRSKGHSSRFSDHWDL